MASPLLQVDSAPPSAVGGLRWQLRSAAVAGRQGGAPDETELLYLYADGTSVATGFCFTRQGRWRQEGTELLFTKQRTLDHRCAIGMNDSTAARFALLHLDGPMTFGTAANVLTLHNSTTSMRLTAAGSAGSSAGAAAGDPTVAALSESVWQLLSARQRGKAVALPSGEPTTMELHADGTSNMVGPGCFYRTGRWHTVTGGFQLTDQVSVAMSCHAISDMREVAGGSVLAGMVGVLSANVSSTALMVKSAAGSEVFISAGPST